MITLGERIKIIRGECSREKFAPLLGVSKNTIVNYETDVRTPDINFVVRLLELYPDTNPSWLLTGEGPMRENRSLKGENATPPIKPAAAIDEFLLESVIVAVEAYLHSERLAIVPTKKAQLILALYDLFSEKEEKKVDKVVVIRLAKLAA